MGDDIFVPHAIEVDGALITVFDAINHTPVEEKGPDGQPIKPTWDTRWMKLYVLNTDALCVYYSMHMIYRWRYMWSNKLYVEFNDRSHS
jgi:hypothetical protein